MRTMRLLFCVPLLMVLFSGADGYAQNQADVWNPRGKYFRKEPFKVLFFGDSMLSGYGLPNPKTSSIPELVSKHPENEKNNEIPRLYLNMSHAGETSSSAVTRIKQAMALKPDIVVLCLGFNDARRKVDTDIVMNNINIIITDLTRAGIYVLFIGLQAPQNSGYNYISSFNAVIAKLNQQNPQAIFMPYLLEEVIHDRILLQRDEMHPNLAGAKIVAKTVSDYINKMLLNLKRRNVEKKERQFRKRFMLKENEGRARRGLPPLHSKEEIDAMQ